MEAGSGPNRRADPQFAAFHAPYGLRVHGDFFTLCGEAGIEHDRVEKIACVDLAAELAKLLRTGLETVGGGIKDGGLLEVTARRVAS